MHELSLAHAIGEIAAETLRNQPSGSTLRVGRVRVRVGDLAGVDPEALAFCFEVVRGEWEGTSEASLEIERSQAYVVCAQCGGKSEFSTESVACAACGSLDHRMTSGRELEVFGVELWSPD